MIDEVVVKIRQKVAQRGMKTLEALRLGSIILLPEKCHISIVWVIE
jgi:hypothetical protein